MSKTKKTVTSAAETRRTYFKHEGAILAVGQLYYLMAFGLLLAAVTGVSLHGTRGVLSWPDTLWVAGVFVVLAGLYAAAGYAFGKLATWSRFAAGVLALLCLLSVIINTEMRHPVVASIAVIKFFAMPVGIIITLYGVFLALTKKGTKVFSSEYRQVVADTPEYAYAYSRVFLAGGIVLMVVQSLKVLAVFTGRLW